MVGLKKFIDSDKLPNSDLDIKRAVFAFGRMNPPTKGHKKLIDKVIYLAKSDDHFIFPSKSEDKSRNPLDFKTKISFLKKLFPGVKFGVNKEIRTPFDAFGWLIDKGYGNITFVVGSDRVEEFKKQMEPYAKNAVNKFEVVSAGIRDTDAEEVSGMSASTARKAAKENNIGKFRAATGWTGEIVNQLLTAVRKGMGEK